jgi:CheY-like chemotaxis protein
MQKVRFMLSPVRMSQRATPASGAWTDSASSSEENGAQEPLSILVVDDQPDVLQTLADLLELLGFAVYSASSGQEALDVLRQQPDIEVLLTDVMMPHMNGVTLAGLAKALSPQLKVIFASGYPTEALRQAVAESGEFEFLAKPLTVSMLAKALRQ